MDGLTPASKSKPSSVVRELSHIEDDFASLVRGFVSQYRPDQQPFVTRVCKVWAGAWLHTAAGLTPAPGQSIEALEDEVYRARWRRYYARNREKLLQRRRRNWARKHSKPAASQAD